MYLLKTKHENTSKCDNCYSHTLHCIQKGHCQFFFDKKASYGFDRHDHVETTLLWISHTL